MGADVAAAVDTLIRSNPIFARVKPADRPRYEARCRVQRYQARDVVLEEGDEPGFLYALLAGSVRVYHASPGGLEVILKIFRAPAVFGEMEAIVGIPMLENVACLEPVELLIVPRDLLLEEIDGNHAIAAALLRDVCARLCIASQNEKSLAFHSIRERLAHFLCNYAECDGEATSRGTRIRVKLSQDSMAAALGVTRRSIATEVIRWQKLGLLEQRAGHYVVLEPVALAREAGQLELGLHYSLDRGLRGARPGGTPTTG